MRKRDLKKAILDYLNRIPFGATISDISRDLGVSRPTIYRYLSELKAQKLVKEIAVGAYRIYIPHDKFLSEVKMISRKLLCALAYSLEKLFRENSTEISFNLGSILVDSFFELYPGEFKRLELMEGISPFKKLKFVLELFLGREVNLNIIELDTNRCILQMTGIICTETPTLVLLQFLKGAMRRFMEVITENNSTIRFASENIKNIEKEKYVITIEMILISSKNEKDH